MAHADRDEAAMRAYREIWNELDVKSVAATTRRLAGFGSRAAGSKGERRTLEFLESELRQLGATRIRREPFRITVPDPDASGRLRLEGREVQVRPLWPNLVRTSTVRVEGPLAYGGRGSLAEWKGQDLTGRIAVLEFDSGSGWKRAFKLGARAVLFLAPSRYTRLEAEAKFAAVPLAAPRYLVENADAGVVRSAARGQTQAQLSGRQDWVVRESYNLLADFPGSDPARIGERVVIGAAADAMSVVPADAPGVSGAVSLAAMLELARIARARPVGRPITFLAVSAGSLGLQGWREYAERRVQDGKDAFVHLTLDLDDGGEVLGAFARGWFYEYRNETLDPVRGLTRAFRDHANRMAQVQGLASGREMLLDAANDSDGKNWRNALYARFALGCEPLLMSGLPTVTLATAESGRDRIDTPHDDLVHFDFSRIERPMRTLSALLWHVGNDLASRAELSNHKVPIDLQPPRRRSLVGGYGTVEGQVVRFDPIRSFVADIPVPTALAVVEHPQKTLAGVRAPLIQAVEGPRAHFRFLGLAPRAAFFHLDAREMRLAAYGLDPQTGQVAIAPTDGLMGFAYDRVFELVTTYRSLPLVVFDATPTDLYDLIDPQENRPLSFFQVMDPVSDAVPRNFSLATALLANRPSGDLEDAAVLFTERGTRYKLLMTNDYGEWRLVLTNADDTSPAGAGYSAEGATVFPGPDLQTAKDLARLNGSRLADFAKYRILSPDLDRLQSGSRAAIARAEAARAAYDWPTAEREARAAWGLALRAHPQIQRTVNDVVTGVLFYLILLVPFSYFIERLLFGKKKLTSQLGCAIAVFIVAFLFLRAVHPAFQIVTNPSMIFIAFVMGILSLMVGVFIVGKFETSLKELQAKAGGMGHLDIGRMNLAMAAFNLGIANMRRRRARTFLTTLTLVVMTFIVLSFTSFVPGLELAENPAGRPAPYAGLLVRNAGLEPLQGAAYRALGNDFAGWGKVVRRTWFFGAEMGDQSALTVVAAGKSADLRAAVGFDPDEVDVSHPDRALRKGGRWFAPGEDDVALISANLAKRLEVDQGGTIGFAGRKLRVIGILDDALLKSHVDLDGEPVLPADFTLSRRFQARTSSATQAFRRFSRIEPESCVFLPTQIVEALGGELRSVAVAMPKAEGVRPALQSMMPRMRSNLYAGVVGAKGLEVVQFSVLQKSRGAGFGLVLVQMAIASIFVLNTMVASVFERKREIGIFSSIGLAPHHISILFFAESAVYGVLGAVIGYFTAQGVAKLVVVAGWTPGLYLNFSAGSAVMATGIVLGIVLLSTLYPAKVAERLAAPAYASQSFGAPEGDRWSILLPFRVGDDEARPLLTHFLTWFRGHEEYAIGEFVCEGPALDLSDPDQPALVGRVWLTPFDLGVSQAVRFEARSSAIVGSCELHLTLERLAGEPTNWQRFNERFFLAIRREFLGWRTRTGESRSAD